MFSLRYDPNAFECPKTPHTERYFVRWFCCKTILCVLSCPRRVAWRLYKSHLREYAWTDCRPTSVTAATQPFHWNDLNFRIIAYTRLARDSTKNRFSEFLSYVVAAWANASIVFTRNYAFRLVNVPSADGRLSRRYQAKTRQQQPTESLLQIAKGFSIERTLSASTKPFLCFPIQASVLQRFGVKIFSFRSRDVGRYTATQQNRIRCKLFQ